MTMTILPPTHGLAGKTLFEHFFRLYVYTENFIQSIFRCFKKDTVWSFQCVRFPNIQFGQNRKRITISSIVDHRRP